MSFFWSCFCPTDATGDANELLRSPGQPLPRGWSEVDPNERHFMPTRTLSFHSAISSEEKLAAQRGYKRRNLSTSGSVMHLALDTMVSSMKLGSKLPLINDDRQSVDSALNNRGHSFATAFDDGLSPVARPPARNPIGFSTLRQVDKSQKDLPNTWFPIHGREFNVRCGPDYKRNGNKCPSEANLYDTWGTDLISSDEIIRNIAPRLPKPPSADGFRSVVIDDTPAALGGGSSAGGGPQIPAVLIFNAQIPGPGSGFSFISYSVIASQFRNLINKEMEPRAFTLLRRLIDAGASTKQLPIKVIGMVNDIEHFKIPGLLKRKNGQPALVTASAQLSTGVLEQFPGTPSYLEIDYDIRKWSFFARQTLSAMRGPAQGMCLNVGYVLETGDDELLPEQMLTSFCLQRGDLTNVLDIPNY